MPGFVLLVRPRGDDSAHMRVGYTVTKKIGNAVTRNRARRRLKALAAELLPDHGRAATDYVLIARGTTPARAFGELRQDLLKALERLERPRREDGDKRS